MSSGSDTKKKTMLYTNNIPLKSDIVDQYFIAAGLIENYSGRCWLAAWNAFISDWISLRRILVVEDNMF